MNDLAEFLLTRLAEDERAARASAPQFPSPWTVSAADGPHEFEHLRHVECDSGRGDVTDWLDPQVAEHIAFHDPARVLAECEAKRLIVESYKHHAGRYTEEQYLGGIHTSLSIIRDSLLWVMLRLALPYADHPDYREEWRP